MLLLHVLGSGADPEFLEGGFKSIKSGFPHDIEVGGSSEPREAPINPPLGLVISGVTITGYKTCSVQQLS